MLLSFVIPHYSKDCEGESYLGETIQACIDQFLPEYPPHLRIEIIVVDDGSPKPPHKLMSYFMSLDKRVFYHPLCENHGNAVVARNKGTELSRGTIILPTDHDDPPLKNRAWATAKFFHRNVEFDTDLDCFHGGWNECAVDGGVVRSYAGREMSLEIFNKGNFLWHHGSAGLKKKILLELPYREDPGKTDDYCLLEDWLNAGKIFKHTEEVLGNQRRLPWGQMAKTRVALGMPPNWIG